MMRRASLSHLGIRQAYVFGVSMGGMIAQEFVLRQPQMVRRLVFGCTSCGGPQAFLASLEVLAQLIHPPDMSLEEAVRRQWTVMFSPKFLATQQDFLDRLTQRALCHPAPPHTSLRHLMAMQRFNTYGRLGMITTPTLVITGADDVIVPLANSLLLATRIHGAYLEILTNTGHGFFWEVPWDVAALFTNFATSSNTHACHMTRCKNSGNI